MTMTPPMIVGAVVGVGLIALLYRFRKRNDLQAWMRLLRHKAERAGTDEAFRAEELRNAEEKLAEYTPPEPPTPLTRRQEMIVQLLPKFLFINGAGGVILAWLGAFKPLEKGQFNWPLAIGLALMGITGLGIALTARLRRHHDWIQQLNRKYLMVKAAGDKEEILSTMDRILQYYPAVPELWLEKADQLSRYGNLPDALTAVKKARELSPKNMDMAVVEVSFMLRNNNLFEAERALKEMDEMPKAPSDPRVEIYRAQLALLKNELTKAKKHAEKAAELDSSFATLFLDREESLRDLKAMMKEMKLIF